MQGDGQIFGDALIGVERQMERETVAVMTKKHRRGGEICGVLYDHEDWVAISGVRATHPVSSHQARTACNVPLLKSAFLSAIYGEKKNRRAFQLLHSRIKI